MKWMVERGRQGTFKRYFRIKKKERVIESFLDETGTRPGGS